MKSSSIEKKKIKPAAINNKKKETVQKPKLVSAKTVDKKKKSGMNITGETGLLNSSVEVKSQRDKMHLTKQRKDKDGGSKSTNTRNAKTNKSKEYENTLSKLTGDNEIEKEKEKEFDFLNFRFSSNATKKTKEKDKSKEGKKEKIQLYEDKDDSGAEDNKNDILHMALYRTSLDRKGLINDKISEIQNDRDKSKEKKIEKPRESADNKFGISMEKTDDIRYNIGDKKIYSNINNDKPKKPMILLNERTVDFYVIDSDENIIVSTKFKKKIDRKRNKFKEINIEKYDPSAPHKNEKFSGYVLIRKTKGKKIYEIELEDDIDNINEILEQRNIMISNEVIQIIPLKRLLEYKNNQKNYNEKIFELQSELNKKEINKEREKEKERESRERDNKELKEKEKQISLLKVKNDELNSLVKTQEQQILQHERELKQAKTQIDKLKEQYQNLETENKSLADQVESYKVKKKKVQLQ